MDSNESRIHSGKAGNSVTDYSLGAANSGALAAENQPHPLDLAFLLDHWSSISDATRRQIVALAAGDLQLSVP